MLILFLRTRNSMTHQYCVFCTYDNEFSSTAVVPSIYFASFNYVSNDYPGELVENSKPPMLLTRASSLRKKGKRRKSHVNHM